MEVGAPAAMGVFVASTIANLLEVEAMIVLPCVVITAYFFAYTDHIKNNGTNS